MYNLILSTEHINRQPVKLYGDVKLERINFENKCDKTCLKIDDEDSGSYLFTSYYIGVDWITEKDAVFIQPKINNGAMEINFLKMLMDCMQQPGVLENKKDLFEIKFDAKPIEIKQKEDLLTPLLVIQFLTVLKKIVRKGLKKSYYKVEQNLNAKIKGKLMVGNTLKKNVLNNRPLKNYCTYQEYGYNGLENQLLKKTLMFVCRYLAMHRYLNHSLKHLLDYCLPAFEEVDEKIDISTLQKIHFNAFYTEYKEALSLSNLILKRFGYTINSINKNELIKTPPFWVDMSKLFELYVLGLLRNKFKNDVLYQFKVGSGNELDYLLKTKKNEMVIDAKYIPIWKNCIVHENVRQVSGYARLKGVYKELSKTYPECIDCLIIYPDVEEGKDKIEELKNDWVPVNEYYGVYKLGIKLPIIESAKKS